MLKSTKEKNANGVNGTPSADCSGSVAPGQLPIVQVGAVRNPATEPGRGGNQASPVAAAKTSTGTRSCSGDQAIQTDKPVETTGNPLLGPSAYESDMETDLELNNSKTPILHDKKSAISENILTMEPYENIKNPNYNQLPRPKTSNHDRFQQLFSIAKFNKFYSIKSTGDADLTKLNMFKVDKAIKQLIGNCEKISEDYQNKGWTVEVKTEQQAQQILQLKTLISEEVTVTPHRKFNESQGVITCALLKGYTEDDIVDGLSESGVIRCHRIVKKANSPNPKPTATLILTFNSSIPPDRICIRTGLQERVRPYIPLPRRCHTCQRYGHSALKCRRITPVCNRCSGDFNDNHNSSNCERTPYCLHCDENHMISSRTCSKYLLEKEVLAIKTREHITFPEARAKANLNFNHTNKSYASQVGTTNNIPVHTTHTQPIAPSDETAPETNDMNNNIEDHNINPLNIIQCSYNSPPSRTKRQLSDNSPKPRNKSPKRQKARTPDEERNEQEWTQVHRKQRSRSRPTNRYNSKERAEPRSSSIDISPERNSKFKPQYSKTSTNSKKYEKTKTDKCNR